MSVSESAIVLANGHFETSVFAKTAHGMVRGPCRYRLHAVVDPACAGSDAGELLDGRRRDVPVVASIDEAHALDGGAPEVCVLGIATEGGHVPHGVRADLLAAARAGMTLVSGMHELLGDDAEIAGAARQHGARIVDLRRPRPVSELRFWSGAIRDVSAPRVAVLGTDCALGKRTTCTLMRDECRTAGLRAEMVYTGQTGWLQGMPHGFILDATPNDFVSGELERAVLACAEETDAEVILIEGQSSLRNPSGPCGAELLVSAAAAGVILQHAPGRELFEGLGEAGGRVPSLASEIELVRMYGVDVWACTLNVAELEPARTEAVRAALEGELQLPVVLPLGGGMARLVEVLRERLAERRP